MNEPKVTDLDYINFLLAAPRVVSCTEGARVQPDGPHPAAHDALNRLLYRLEPDTTPLWREAEALVDHTRGLLIIDDTTLDKPYAHLIALVHRHWSGKHRKVVSGIRLFGNSRGIDRNRRYRVRMRSDSAASGREPRKAHTRSITGIPKEPGINLVTLVWSDDTHAVPCDYRLFDAPNDALTKNDHFRAMLQTAKDRGFTPRFVCFDSWYSGLANLKYIRTLGWHWQTQLNANRLVNPDGTGNRQLADCAIRNAGRVFRNCRETGSWSDALESLGSLLP